MSLSFSKLAVSLAVTLVSRNAATNINWIPAAMTPITFGTQIDGSAIAKPKPPVAADWMKDQRQRSTGHDLVDFVFSTSGRVLKGDNAICAEPMAPSTPNHVMAVL